ncbi:hypothetical protein Syun_009143 [Stephania yunnanensis]|uniref:Zinc finger PHD-type domain-containing protein n=1 Tax=Stephania yunnanensis TaxID=152371 RepID=A0AAP0PQD0_9MAGN
MRGGRSHRLPSNEPLDDWGDGSWTVDCACGVNFDDGEEMVNCDECGVWVHTRCSRFVKGETSFACDKCKRRKNRVDNEETEVARLLVELPMKSMKMENSFSSIPSWSSVRLWSDIPIEERVHVHGVPGGDPTLFQDMPSIFSHELWRCTGYVAKKLNFQYREFPCWDEQDKVDVEPLEVDTPLDKGANALFSFSKVVATNPMDMVVGLKGSIEGDRGNVKPFLREIKKREEKGSSVVRMQNSVKRDRNYARPLGVPYGKRKNDDLGLDKDEGVMKNANCFDKGVCGKKKVATLTTEARKIDFGEDECLKAVEPVSNDIQIGIKKESKLLISDSDYYNDAREDNLVTKANHTEHSERVFRIETVTKSEKFDSEVPSGIGSGSITPSPLRSNDIGCPFAKEEDFNAATDQRRNLGDLRVSPSTAMEDSSKLKHPSEDLMHASTEVKDGQILCNQKCRLARSLAQPDIEQNVEDAEQLKENTDLLCSSCDVVRTDVTRRLNHHEEISAAHSYKNWHETNVASCPSDKSKTEIDESELEAASHYSKDDPAKECVSIYGEPCANEQGNDSSDAVVVRRSSSDPKLELRNAEPLRAEGVNHSSVVSISGNKHVPSNGKTSTSSSVVCPRSANLGCYRPASPNTKRYINSSKQRAEVTSSADVKKEYAVNDVTRDDGRHEMAKKTLKEQPKGSQNSRLKASELSKASHVSAAKRMLSDSKFQVLHPSSKSVTIPNAADSSGSGESANSLQTAQHCQNKPTSTGFSQKGEKSNHLSSQHSSKINPSSSVYPNTLSDEELALLLHQELNSSPRVPRVPRVRQAGSMPPLASAAATSMLIKRTSSHGGKDQTSVSRRKSKEDSLKDSIHSSCERTDMTKRVEKTLLSSDKLTHELISEGSTKNEIGNRSFEAQLSQKNKCITTTIVSPSPTEEADDQNLLFVHNSTRDVFDNDNGKDGDNACSTGGSIPRTLPGLIDEILSRGNNISCRELCDAVLPHWDDLRKLNGERYAYSSHSQAVLDCLRNRNEWAQLVDRGPKTNSGKKRRKHDAELPEAEVDGKDNNNEGISSQKYAGKNVESRQEDYFPKGKRKARKRRRLALKGRGISDVRRRQISTEGDAFVDNDVGPFSHSSDDEGTGEVFSEDEIQGSRRHSVGSEAAASSSDEAGSA